MLLALLIFVLAFASSAMSEAHADVVVRDPKDRMAPLDIVKARIRSIDERVSVARVTFRHAITRRDFGFPNFFALVINRDGDRKPEHLLYVIPYKRQLKVLSHNVEEDSDFCCSGGVRMLNRRTLRIRFGKYIDYIPEPKGLRLGFLAGVKNDGRCSSGCIDVLPRRGWIIHDWTPPNVTVKAPSFALADARSEAAVSYQVSDAGRSGIGRHALMRRPLGTSEWSVVTAGSSSGEFHARLKVPPGQTIELRAVAVDGQGNRTVSDIERVLAPYDESSGTVSGLWEQRSVTGTYRGTDAVSTSPVDEFTFSGYGDRYCILYTQGAEYGRAVFVTEAGEHPFDMAGESQHLKQKCLTFYEPQDRDIRLRVEEGTINIDGFFIKEIPE